MNESYWIDLANSGNFNILIDFDKKVLKASSYGDNLPNISNNIDNLYFKCSLLNDSIVSGQRTNILYSTPANTKTRGLPFQLDPQHLLWKDSNQEIREEIKQETPKQQIKNEKIVEEIRMPEIAGDEIMKLLKKPLVENIDTNL